MEELVIQRQSKQTQYYIEALNDELNLEMIYVQGGTFTMGSPEDEAERMDDEGPPHNVTVPSFFMGRYPITQAQWHTVANLPQINTRLDANPSDFRGDNRPVENISWIEAVEYSARLTEKTGRAYRLPSEAEWEYACRAGTKTPFNCGETLTPEIANYEGNYSYGKGPKGEFRKETTPVNYFKFGNAWGLSDMHGNVWEWCQDHWHDNYQDAPNDGSAWLYMITDEDQLRIARGGSWDLSPGLCRSAYRSYNGPGVRGGSFGFRVVVSAPSFLQ